MIGFKDITCVRCHHYFMVASCESFHICPFCGQMFNYDELIPFFYSEGVDFDPKRYKRDWIVQEEELEISRIMGNKV